MTNIRDPSESHHLSTLLKPEQGTNNRDIYRPNNEPAKRVTGILQIHKEEPNVAGSPDVVSGFIAVALMASSTVKASPNIPNNPVGVPLSR